MICTKCKEDLDDSKFYRRGSGFQKQCKLCMKESYNRSRKAKQTHYQGVQKKRYTDNMIKIRAWKSERGCSHCPENFDRCLELHHLDPTTKEYEAANLGSRSYSLFLKEAEKCIVLCSNCHKKEHYRLEQISRV